MKRLKVAQIGASETAHSAHILKSMLEMPEDFEVLGVADVDFHPGNRLDPVFSCVPQMSAEELLSLPLDAVIIETDEALQTQYAMMAVERGFAVAMDKPGSQDDRAFDALIDRARENGVVFFVNYMYRYNPAVMYARELISRGGLGDVLCIEAQMNCFHNGDLQKRYAGFSGGVMYYLGCHMTDVIFDVLGAPAEVIPFNTATRSQGTDAEDFGMAVLRYENGASIAKVNASEVAGAPMRRSIVYSGTKGTLEIRPIEQPVRDLLNATEITEKYPGGEVLHKDFPVYGRYTRMLSEFARIVRGEQPPRYSYEYERALHKLILRTCGVPVSDPSDR